MIRPLVYWTIACAIILAGGFALNFLANEPGSITIDYADRVWVFTPLKAAIVLVIGLMTLMAAFWAVKLVWAIGKFLLTGDDTGFGGLLARRRERTGLDALAKGMVALEAGDAKTAKRKAEIAERKLGKPSLTRLLNAKAAEMAGDHAKAETYYKALMSDSNTAFVGAQGLLGQAIAADDTDRAMKFASKAIEYNPKNAGVLDALYMLQSQKFDWEGARGTLKAQRRAGLLPQLEADRRESGLALAQSEDAESAGEIEHARQLAVDAAKLDPTNANAITTAVRMLNDTGSKRTAAKLVQEGWRAKPQAQLAAAYATIEPDEAPAARARRFEALFALQPDHPETHYLKAELALMDKNWGTARKAIEQLRETEPTARTCAIMAAISRGEGEPEAIVRGWLARALGAPRDEATESLLSGAAMLPLLVEPDAELDRDDRTPDTEDPTEGPVEGTTEDEAPKQADPAPEPRKETA